MTLKPSSGQFKPMDDSRSKLRRPGAGSGKYQGAPVERDFDAIAVYARQGDKNDHLVACFKHIHRRLPAGRPRSVVRGHKNFSTHAVGAVKRRERLGPHPGTRKFRVHLVSCLALSGTHDERRQIPTVAVN
jgi:hypothetical protein